MSSRTDPAALRWLVGAELANYRAETGLSLTEAAQATGVSRSKLGHMESGRYQQHPEDIATVLKAYEVLRSDIDRVASLAGHHGRKAWWAPWKALVPSWLGLYLGLEGMAESVFTYEPNMIPGLLQTRDYALAITRGTERARPDHIERFVQLRMARAKRLREPMPLRMEAIIGEAALRLSVGTPEVRRAQFEHLLKCARLRNVTLRIVRPEDGYHQALPGHFAIFTFALARPAAYVELQDDAVYVSAPQQVWPYTSAADSLRRVALSHRASAELIESVINK